MENTKTLVSKDSIFKRYFWVFVLLAIVAAVVCFNVMPKAFAAFSDKPQVENSFNAFIEGFEDTLFDRMLDYYKKFSDFMQPHNSGSQFKTDFVSFIQALGQAMVVLYMLVNMIQEAQKGDPTLDYWTKIFLRTAVAMLMVMMISQIISGLYDFGGAIIEKAGQGMMQSAGEATRPNKEQWADAIAKLPGMKDVGEILGSGAKGADAEKAAVNWYKLQGVGQISKMLNYVVWFPMGVCIFLMFSAIFEIKIRQLFAPVAVAAISYEGARGSGVRYLKKYLGCLFKIVIYFGIAGIGSSLTLHFLGQIGDDEINVVFALLSNVVAGLAMMQSGGIGDEILGA